MFFSKGGWTVRGACLFSDLQAQMMYFPGMATSSQLCKICNIHPVPLLFFFSLYFLCSLSWFDFLTSAPPKPLGILISQCFHRVSLPAPA